MSSPSRTDHSDAIGTLLKIVALGAGGLLFVLLVLIIAGGHLFEVPKGMDPAMAGLAVGKPAPDLAAGGWINGEPEPYEGKVTLVQGWFYDCPYCWQEAPEIAKLHAKYGDRMRFVALSPDPLSDAQKVQEFVDKGGLKYPVGFDAREALIGFEAQAFPVLWLVGSNGTVIWNGAEEGKQSLEEAIEAALQPNKA